MKRLKVNEEIRFSNALKSIARDQGLKSYIQLSEDLYPIFMKGAKRFVAGGTRREGLERVMSLSNEGYEVSLEYLGENTSKEEECILAKNEFRDIINDLGAAELKATVSFDLSHIGMMVSEELALCHLKVLAKEAAEHGIQLMISMEESTKTDQILSIYKKASTEYPNVGITLQAHLKRSDRDLEDLLKYPGRIRLVKGAYQEPKELYIPRSAELDERYIEFVTTCVQHQHPLSIATHDENILMKLKEKGLLDGSTVEVEMLDGVRPDLKSSLKDSHVQMKVYVTYGSEWYLYLLHRIAEHPPNIYSFISDIIERKQGDGSVASS